MYFYVLLLCALSAASSVELTWINLSNFNKTIPQFHCTLSLTQHLSGEFSVLLWNQAFHLDILSLCFPCFCLPLLLNLQDSSWKLSVWRRRQHFQSYLRLRGIIYSPHPTTPLHTKHWFFQVVSTGVSRTSAGTFFVQSRVEFAVKNVW